MIQAHTDIMALQPRCTAWGKEMGGRVSDSPFVGLPERIRAVKTDDNMQITQTHAALEAEPS